MDKGIVSIVVPVYNVENYLERCIDSVFVQSYKEWELLLIDDGSVDRSGEICDRYAAVDARVQVRHTENRGVSAARNLGLSLARGEYVLFADSDDWLDFAMLEKLVTAIERDNTQIAVCDVNYVFLDKDGNESISQRKKWGNYAVDTVIENTDIYHAFFLYSATLWNKLIRADLIQNTRFDTKQRYGEDTAFLLALAPSIKKVTILPYYGYYYFVGRPGNVVSEEIGKKSLEFIQLYTDIYKKLSLLGMGGIGVYRIYFSVKHELEKIPKAKRHNSEYAVYYDAAKKALKTPTAKDIILFLRLNGIGKKTKLKFCLGYISEKWLMH